MKKLIWLLVCILILVSTNLFPAYATVYDDVGTVEIASVFVSDSRSGQGFVEGERGEFTYRFALIVNGVPVIIDQYISYECEYVCAPYTGQLIQAYSILNDFSDELLSYLNTNMSDEFPEAVKSRSATRLYNCHSYAWYDTDLLNDYWIDDPTNYYSNNAYYTEVTTPAVGDIICYFNGNVNLHSGIVTAINVEASNNECGNSNTVEVISKWGMSGLYMHNGYECPYTSYSESGEATSVKYYRHVHSYSYTNITSNHQHRATCRTCGYTFVETHTWKILLNGSQKCQKCGVTTTGHVILSVEEHNEHE